MRMDHSSFLADTPASPPGQYAASRQKKVTGLIEKGVFQVVDLKEIPPDIRIFKLRFVDEIKNQGTNKAFKKSRLVVQAYNNADKTLVFTQSPTIQRVSQRVIICLAAIFQDKDTKLFLREITQAYVQSTSYLNREFFI